MKASLHCIPVLSGRWRLGGALALATCLGVGLSACAPIPAHQESYPVGRARLVLPLGDWVELGHSEEVLPLFPELGDTIPLQTRAVGLRGRGNDWLAILVVQTNSTNTPRPHTLWTATCPQQRGVLVEDATAASPVRVDCLRFKRWADSGNWLEKNDPVLSRWLSVGKVAVGQPASHVNYRYATEGGAYVQVNALVDQRLLRPETRNNEAFLRAGQPAQAWISQLAEAARLSVGALNGVLPVPAFPIPLPN